MTRCAKRRHVRCQEKGVRSQGEVDERGKKDVTGDAVVSPQQPA